MQPANQTEAMSIWGLLGAGWNALEMLMDSVIVAVLAVYWSVGGDYFERLWLSLLAVDKRTAARDVVRSLEAEVGAYLRSEGLQAVAAAALLWLGYVLLGYPYPAFLAMVVAAVWLAPWAGTVLALVAVAALSVPRILMDGDHILWTQMLPAAAYTAAVLWLLEHQIEPRLFDRRRYNSLLIMLTVIVLAECLGVWGLLLGPPLAAAIQILGAYFLLRATIKSDNCHLRRRSLRVAALQEQLATAADAAAAPPELVSVVDRLKQLIDETLALERPDELPNQGLAGAGGNGSAPAIRPMPPPVPAAELPRS